MRLRDSFTFSILAPCIRCCQSRRIHGNVKLPHLFVRHGIYKLPLHTPIRDPNKITMMKLILFVLLYASNCVCRIEQCEMEDNIHYNGNDDKMPDGKLKCTGGSLCTQNPITDASSCKSFCSTSKYFTWKASAKVCYCKNSDSRRSQEGGTVSGKTNCPYNE